MSHHLPHTQSEYQLHFDWGYPGADAVAADADVIVWVDALDAGGPALERLQQRAAVFQAALGNARATAAAILEVQVALGRRAPIALIGAGAQYPDGRFRTAVEDSLLAGAVIDELMALGIDYASPEAAVACAGYTGLRRAVAHLLTASVTGQELGQEGMSEAIEQFRAADAGAVLLREHAELG